MTESPADPDERLVPTYRSDRVWNAVTTTPDGRVFVGQPGIVGPAPQAAEITSDGTITPYPDEEWNRPGHDPTGRFVRVSSLRIGPDDRLWIVDAGAPKFGDAQVPGGARLVVVDVTSGEVVKIHDLGPGVRESSYVDDLRFNGDLVYLTDAGAPGLLVLEPGTGRVRRVLDGHPSMVDRRPLYADGQVLRDDQGAELCIHANQLEVSPDGRYLYYQPSSGPLSRIETRWLNDPDLPADALAERVEEWVDTPTTGGTAIDAAGVIYLCDTDRHRILRITPDRRVETLIADPRLVWSDALWLDGGGFLWIPATEQNRLTGLFSGQQEVGYPLWIYRLRVGVLPAPNDHR